MSTVVCEKINTPLTRVPFWMLYLKAAKRLRDSVFGATIITIVVFSFPLLAWKVAFYSNGIGYGGSYRFYDSINCDSGCVRFYCLPVAERALGGEIFLSNCIIPVNVFSAAFWLS